MGSRQAVMACPAEVDRRTFHDLCVKYGPGKVEDDVFTNMCSEGEDVIARDTLLALSRHTDVFLSYDGGIDCNGRYTGDRVKAVNKALRGAGFLTWFGEEQALRHGCIFDPQERSKEGIESTQLLLVFVTKRYSDLIERRLHSHVNINLDAGAGSAGGDTGELCGFEFEHGWDFKGRNYLRALVPCVLEERMKDVKNWGPRLRETLGRRFLMDLTNFESDPEVLREFFKFITSAIGVPLRRGGPFLQKKNADLTSTKGRHYRWLKHRCTLPQPKAVQYAEAFEAQGIMSTSRLFHCLEKNARYLQDSLLVTDETDAARIAKAVQLDIRGNINRDNQDKIVSVLAQKKEVSLKTLQQDLDRLDWEKAHVREAYEDEEMRKHDRHSKNLFFNIYIDEVHANHRAASNARLEAAVIYDTALREGEQMLDEDILSSEVLKAEKQRRKDLCDLCVLTNAQVAAAHVRRLSEMLSKALSRSPPSSLGDRFVSKNSAVASSGATLVEQPQDTNWHRLLEELTHTLLMVRRICESSPETQKALTDKGVLKVIQLLLSPACTKTSNLFVVPSPRTIEAARLCHSPHLDELLTLSLSPTHTSVSIAGIEAVRYLCRCHRDSTDLSGNNDRNVFLLGQAGAIEQILSIVMQHLRSIKHGVEAKRTTNGAAVNDDRLQPLQLHQPEAVSQEELVRRSTRAVYSALECIFSMSGRGSDHPNKTKFAEAGVFEVLLRCSQSLQDSPIVYRWVGKLLVLLFDETSDPNVRGRVCTMITRSLRRFIDVAGACTGGCTALGHLAFVSVLTELYEPALATRASFLLLKKTGPLAPSHSAFVSSPPALRDTDDVSSFIASIQNSITYWLRERGAALMCLECIERHYLHPQEGAPLVASAARALGNLCYRNAATKALFLDPARVKVVVDAAKHLVGCSFAMAELLFAIGNLVDISSALGQGEDIPPDSGFATTDNAASKTLFPALDAAFAETKPTATASSSSGSSGNGNGSCTPTAAELLVSIGAMELVQTALVDHRDNPDCCYMGLHAFAKMFYCVLQAHNVTLAQRIICIGTCDQVCKTMLRHPDRLDIFLFGCQALDLVVTSPFDGITQGTQRIISAACCEAINTGLRTATAAPVTIFARPTVVQSPDVHKEEDGGQHDPLLYAGAAFFAGCRTVQNMLRRSIRPKDFLAGLQKHGILSSLGLAPVARIRAMTLQVKRCTDLGELCGNIALNQAMMYVQAGCEAEHLSSEQKAEEASSNNPSCYPRRVEFFGLVPAHKHEENLVSLFELLALDWINWAENKA